MITWSIIQCGKMFVRLICPFLYSLLLGGLWSSCFKKKFFSSLAPAYMLHVIFILLSGLFFNNLSYGIFGGIIISCLFSLVLLYKNRNSLSKSTILELCKKMWDDGVFLFSVFYVFCFLINYNKKFIYWDEFSHWGMFLKESLRLDSLYCMSPLPFAHKDYVPAITLFEAVWCRLSGRYGEPDVYRAIQVFMFSMLMPVFERINDFSSEKGKECNTSISKINHKFIQLSALLLILLIPLVFNTNNAFLFYHSIYCDFAVGLIFFWCIFEAYRDYDDKKYHIFELSIGISVLVMAKMTAIALIPLVVTLLLVNMAFFSNKKALPKHYMMTSLTIIFPIGLWGTFNKFVDKYVQNTGSVQSYDGVKLSSLKEVFIGSAQSSISYLEQVRKVYVDAIIHRDILIHGSYLVAMVFIVIAFFTLAHFSSETINKTKIIAAGIWTSLSGLYYALLMYFLYCTAFDEYEAVRLASYERYMNSFLVAALFFLIAIYFDSEIWKSQLKVFYCLVLFLFMDLSFLHVDAFDQMLPGTLSHDDEIVNMYASSSANIIRTADEDESIYIIKRGDNGGFIVQLRYYCSPRIVNGGSVGPATNENDIWSYDISVEDFVHSVEGYDYIYFCELDDAFVDKYSNAFEDPTQVMNGGLYKIIDASSKIKLQ